jgi:HlyD family secretion protein
VDRKIEKKYWTSKRIVLLSTGSIFLFLIIYWSVFGDRSRRYNVDVEKITISTVIKGPFNEYIPVVGTVIPIKTVYLDAIEGGRVDKIFVEAGNMVERGENLFQLVNTDLLLDISYKETELYNLINSLRNTQLNMEQNSLALSKEIMEVNYKINQTKRIYEKNDNMINMGGISRQEYEKSKDEYEYYLKRKEFAIQTFKQDSLSSYEKIKQSEASLKRMRSNLDIAKTKLENLIIKAPISGNLTSFNVEIGELKSRGQRFGQIDVLDEFKVRAEIDEHYIVRINTGLKG